MEIKKPNSVREFATVTFFAFLGVIASLLAVSMIGWVIMVIVNAVLANGAPAFGGIAFLSLVAAFILALNSYQ